MIKKVSDKLKYLIPVVVTLLIMFIVEHLHPKSSFSARRPHIVDSSLPFLGQEMFSFLWQYRGMDIIIQSFILFTAIISCIALLRTERGE